MANSFLKTKTFIVPGIILLLIILFLFSKQYSRKVEIEREISDLEKEIAGLQGKNEEIGELIEYFQTSEFKERQARSLLKLQKEGEFAVALPNRNESGSSAATQSGPETVSNLEKWWQYFFSNFANVNKTDG